MEGTWISESPDAGDPLPTHMRLYINFCDAQLLRYKVLIQSIFDKIAKTIHWGKTASTNGTGKAGYLVLKNEF